MNSSDPFTTPVNSPLRSAFKPPEIRRPKVLASKMLTFASPVRQDIPAAVIKSPIKKNHKKKARGGKERKVNMRRAIARTLKNIHPTLTISSKAMEVMNDLLMDALWKLSDTAGGLMNQTGARKTMDSRTIQCAVKLALPGQLVKHAISEGNKAVWRYAKATV